MIVFELADQDWDWFKLIINNYNVNGHLQRVSVVRHLLSSYHMVCKATS